MIAALPRRDRGFTLLEIAIVVAIAGIIIALVTVGVVHGRAASQVTASEANMRGIAIAEEGAFSDDLDYVSGQSTETVFGKHLPGGTTLAPNGQPYTVTVPQVPPAQANTVGAEVFIITDPGTYDATLLSHLPQGDVATGNQTGAVCASSCTHLAYSKQSGVFGY